MKLSESITVVPFLHGNHVFARHIREVLLQESFDCCAADIPSPFEPYLSTAIDSLPVIGAATAVDEKGTTFYVPADPCDATIEALRQCSHRRVPYFCIGLPRLYPPPPVLPLPDSYASRSLGFDTYCTLCLHTLGTPPRGSLDDETARYCASRLLHLQKSYKRILALVHFRHFTAVAHYFNSIQGLTPPSSDSPWYQMKNVVINPDHLYFALGELPFLTGKIEQERYNPFMPPVDILDSIKELFRETRDDYLEKNEHILQLSPARVQIGLQFLRNLTVMDRMFIPSLFDIVAAAKGIGGNSFALKILKSAKYYPFLPVDKTGPVVSIGINKCTHPTDGTIGPAVNLFQDGALTWRTVAIRPEPTATTQRRYRFVWNPSRLCSYLPEDFRIERFNTYLKNKALRIACETNARTEEFTASVKDGIDIRETLRNWYTHTVYVRELPPVSGNLDTVIIIFDAEHDERYPHYATWYAEHEKESTLTFYATDPFDSMIGPGIARSYYGGVSLLYPPRSIPNIFELTHTLPLRSLAEKLTYGSLLFSQQRHVAYVAPQKPGVQLKQIARRLKRHLIWIPLATFSSETLRKLREFHVLNGKEVRSWAARFIGE